MQITFTKDTEKHLDKQNPKLNKNEIIIVTDCGPRKLTCYKIGDGKTKYSELPLLGRTKFADLFSELDYVEVAK